jgi:hypothetical protein
MDQEVARKMFDEKVRRGIFNPVFRHVPFDAEDRMQDALGLTWRLFAQHAADGELLDDALLVHSCRLRAIDLSRHVAGGCSKRDALDPRNRMVVELVHIDGGDIGWAEPFDANPLKKIISALDLGLWVSGLDEQDRRLLELRMAGHTLEEIGGELDMSTSTVCKRCRELGQVLALETGTTFTCERRCRRPEALAS